MGGGWVPEMRAMADESCVVMVDVQLAWFVAADLLA